MSGKVDACPKGYHTVTAYLVVRDAAAAIEFYKKAFGAVEVMRMTGPGGRGVMHAEIKIGDSHVMMGEEAATRAKSPQTLGGTAGGLHLYVDHVDAAFKQAIAAGGKSIMEPMDMFWGDRYGKLVDPFGHEWSIATHTRDLTPEQIKKGGDEMMAQMAKQQPAGKR